MSRRAAGLHSAGPAQPVPGSAPRNRALSTMRWCARALGLAGCLLAPGSGWADEDRPAIQADQSVADAAGETRRYLNNVVIEQGHLHVEADRVTEYLNNGVTTRIVATGSPAVIRHRIAGAAASSSAEAEEFVYLVNEKTVLLKNFVITHGNGVVQKGKRARFVLE